MVGEILANRYLIKRALGEGAMGQVWLVEDTTTGQTVAMKVIAKRLADTERSVLDFIQEFRLMTQLRHQNCCEVADYGLLPDDVPYLTMELVPGQGLDELIPLPGDRFESVFSQLLLALGYIHSRGFVHCDLKSQNVRVRPDGVVKLMDYGLMEYAGRTDGPIKGTIAYMAPEMIKRGLIDRRADLYSVGCLAYELLTGRVPFAKDRPGDVLRAHLGDRPVPPSLLVPGIDPRHEAIVLKLMAKDPIDRYQAADEVLAALGMGDATVGGTALLTSPLMGRAQEMAKLFVHLARIVTGKGGGVVWLSGPAGIGKTRLLKEFNFNVQLENLPSATGASHEFAQAPYGPFLAVLRGLLPAFKDAIPEAFERHGPLLARLLPELAAQDGEGGLVPAPALESASSEKLRLQATITELLVGLARKRGAVIVLEDWQWADPLSRETFEHLVRAAADVPLLFIVASRQPPPDPAPFKLVTMSLPGLTEASVRRMAASMLGTPDLDTPIVQALLELGEGNPYQLEVLLEHLVASSLLVKDGGQWVARGELTTESLPKGLRALLAQKLNTLPEGAQRLARIAAVFGHAFPLELMRQVAGATDEELFQALGQLVQHQVLVQDEAGHYRFAQEQLQELLYAGLADVDRRRLHGAVARALEGQLAGLAPAEMPLEALTVVADQWLQADEPAKTVAYALEAGLRHLDLFANAPAERYLAAGLGRLDADDAACSGTRLDYLRGMGDLQYRSGRVEAARESYAEAIALAGRLGDGFLLGRLLMAQARVFQGLDELKTALGFGVRGARVALEAGDTVGATRCLLVNARTRHFMGREAEAIADLHEALALARTTGDKAGLGEALASLGYMYVVTDTAKVGEGMGHLVEAVSLLEEVGDKQGVLVALGLQANALARLGDFAAARDAFDRALALARQVDNHPEICSALIGLATCAVELGAFREAVELARAGAQEALNVQSTYQMGIGVVLEAFAQANLGQVGEARALARVAVDLAGELNHKFMEICIQQYRAEVLLLAGEVDEAARATERLQRLMRETGTLEPQARLYVLLGEVFGRQGDLEGAGAYLEAAYSIASLGLARGTEVRALVGETRVAVRQQDWERARGRGEAALALATSLQSTYLQADVHGLLGEVALATGQSTAREHFAAMSELAGSRGYGILLAIAEFGLAASQPYAPEAAELARGAGDRLRALVQGLDEEQRARFLAFPERQRVIEGNHIAFSLPVAGKAAPKPSRPDMWKLMDR